MNRSRVVWNGRQPDQQLARKFPETEPLPGSNFFPEEFETVLPAVHPSDVPGGPEAQLVDDEAPDDGIAAEIPAWIEDGDCRRG